MSTKLDPMGREGETIETCEPIAVDPGDCTTYRVLRSGPIVVAWVGARYGDGSMVTLINGYAVVNHPAARSSNGYSAAILTGMCLRAAGAIDATDRDLCVAAFEVAEMGAPFNGHTPEEMDLAVLAILEALR